MAFELPVKAQLIQDIEQENQTIVPNGMIILEEVQGNIGSEVTFIYKGS
jgi:hypothetical protein